MINRKTKKVFPSKDPKISKIHAEMKSGPIMELASNGPIVVYPTTTIKQACKVMVDNGIRRVPVVDSGTMKLRGILSARDLVDFFGGGPKYNIVEDKYKDNLFAAVNAPVSKIMEEHVISVKDSDSIDNAAKAMLEAGIGGCPVIDKKGSVVAIVSERDFIMKMSKGKHGIQVRDFMSNGVSSVTPGMAIGDAARIMINKGFRRLPVMHEDRLVGMLRTTSILKFISSNDFARFGTANASEILSKEKVGDAMSKYFITVRPEDSIEDLVELMIVRRMGGFLVEENEKISGLVSEHDVFRVCYSGHL